MNQYTIEPYFNLQITKPYHKKTLLEFLKSFNLANNKINYLINNNNCFINGEIANAETILKINDYLSIDISHFETLDYIPNEFDLNILYEDDYLLVINKPSGYIIYPETHDGNNTIANFIANYYHNNQLNLTIRHCHRLDKDTTGCLIIAKDLITHSAMEHLFLKYEIKKTYWALVEGVVKEPGKVTYSIGKDRHTSGKMVITQNGKKALTTYKPLSNKKNTSLLEVMIDTGRTHQIRLHLSTIGHPIVGDSLYGATTSSKVQLHCKSVSFVHPITKNKVYIEANLPNDFKKLLN